MRMPFSARHRIEDVAIKATRYGDYRDFVPNRYRGTRAEVMVAKPAGHLILTRTGVEQVQPDGSTVPWVRR